MSQPAPRPQPRRGSPRLFARGSFLESSRVAEILRAETTGGMLLIAGAVIAIVVGEHPVGGRLHRPARPHRRSRVAATWT